MEVNSLKYYEVYTDTIEFNMNIGGEDETTVLRSCLSRGSPAGFLAEDILAARFAKFTHHVRQSVGYDLLSTNQSRQVEIKSFNQNGVDLSTSAEKGAGRAKRTDFAETAKLKDFIVADMSSINDGKFSYVILPGSYVATMSPKTSFRKRARLFDTGRKPEAVNW